MTASSQQLLPKLLNLTQIFEKDCHIKMKGLALLTCFVC